jgi:hypothetical protein
MAYRGCPAQKSKGQRIEVAASGVIWKRPYKKNNNNNKIFLGMCYDLAQNDSTIAKTRVICWI